VALQNAVLRGEGLPPLPWHQALLQAGGTVLPPLLLA
jgi:hypothetical protein